MSKHDVERCRILSATLKRRHGGTISALQIVWCLRAGRAVPTSYKLNSNFMNPRTEAYNATVSNENSSPNGLRPGKQFFTLRLHDDWFDNFYVVRLFSFRIPRQPLFRISSTLKLAHNANRHWTERDGKLFYKSSIAFLVSFIVEIYYTFVLSLFISAPFLGSASRPPDDDCCMKITS